MKFIFNGSIIKKLRIDKGLSQRKLAKLTGIEQANICRWENSLNTPTATQLAKLAYILQFDFFDAFIIKK